MKVLQITITQFLVISILFIISAFGNTVTLDTSFNGTGYSIIPTVPSPQSSVGQSMVLQPDGKIVIGGSTINDQSPDKFALMRMNSDGSLDTSFGDDGIVLTAVDK